MLAQIYFWNFYFRKLVQHENHQGGEPDGKLSILICAKNELKNLQSLLPSLFNQSIETNILVVDDFSTDDSIVYLSASANEFEKLDYISASKNIPGKKQALMDGLQEIDDDFVLLTDADCIPASKDWAKLMTAGSSANEIILGYSPYRKKTGFLNRWIRFEAILTAIQYLSYALQGNPYMGVGRNILYKKSLIKNADELSSNLDLASGDDDLLVNALATKTNTGIQIDQNAWTYSDAKSTWKEYFKQKRRHMSTASSYKTEDQIKLLLFSVSWILLYLCLIILFLQAHWIAAVTILCIRLISTYISVIPLFSKLDGKDCISHWWYLDPLTAVYFSIFSIFAIFPQRNKW